MYVPFCIFCFHCSMYMCIVLLPPGVNPIAFNKYISYIISAHEMK